MADWNISGMLEDNHICLCKKIDVISQHFYILTARCLIKITINQTNWICFCCLDAALMKGLFAHEHKVAVITTII